jgi:hypothetical protein
MKHPELSEGARLERKAMRNYLRREMKKKVNGFPRSRLETELLELILNWVLARQKRYDKRKGGL